MTQATCRFCGVALDGPPALRVGDRNRRITGEVFDYLRCRACSTLFIPQVPEDLARYYPNDYHGFATLAELDANAAVHEAPKLALITEHVPPAGSLIEIGPGSGSFARAARNAGFTVTGIEMDERCCEYLESVAGVAAIHSDDPAAALANVPPAQVIAMWHVLEHVPDPLAVLGAAAARLDDGGLLIIAMPNPQALGFRLLRGRWAHIDAPRHLSLIPFAALRGTAATLGLSLVSVTTSDPAGRDWNRFAWEYALRRVPGSRPPTRSVRLLSRAIATAFAPVERRGLQGATYTALFAKSGPGA